MLGASEKWLSKADCWGGSSTAARENERALGGEGGSRFAGRRTALTRVRLCYASNGPGAIPQRAGCVASAPERVAVPRPVSIILTRLEG